MKNCTLIGVQFVSVARGGGPALPLSPVPPEALGEPVDIGIVIPAKCSREEGRVGLSLFRLRSIVAVIRSDEKSCRPSGRPAWGLGGGIAA